MIKLILIKFYILILATPLSVRAHLPIATFIKGAQLESKIPSKFMISTETEHGSIVIIGQTSSLEDETYLLYKDYSNGQLIVYKASGPRAFDNSAIYKKIKRLPDFLTQLPAEVIDDLPAPNRLSSKHRPGFHYDKGSLGTQSFILTYPNFAKALTPRQLHIQTYRVGWNKDRLDGESAYSILSVEFGSLTQSRDSNHHVYGCESILSSSESHSLKMSSDQIETLSEHKIWRWNGQKWIRLNWL